MSLSNEVFLDGEILLQVVDEFKAHWVGKFLAQIYIGVYRGTKKQIDWRLFNQLDANNRAIFDQILNMRNGWIYTDEQLYQIEIKLKQLVGIK